MPHTLRVSWLQNKPTDRALSVTITALAAGFAAVCVLWCSGDYSNPDAHYTKKITHNVVAETRYQDKGGFAQSSMNCGPPLVFYELPDPNETISI